MTFQPGAMTDFELRHEIEHHRSLITELSPDAPARRTLQEALAVFLVECEERRELRCVPMSQVEAEDPDDDAS